MTTTAYRFVSFGGLLVMLGLAWALSERRRAVSLRIVLWGLGLQLVLALFVLKTAPGRWVFEAVESGFNRMLSFSNAGAGAVFGKLTSDPSYGALVAFQVLPVIIFVASLSAVLYHLGIVQRVVRAMAWVMQRTMKTSGAESLSAALFVFMGIESVTAIGRYIERMTRSELFVVMTAFLATIATSVMAAYVSFGASAGHLLAASLMSAPAAVVIAKIMIPEGETPLTAGRVEFEPAVATLNVVDAAATGAADGVKLAINIGAMLIAFIALIAMVNFVLEWATGYALQRMLGWVFSGFAAVMGVPREDWLRVGELLGIKSVLNEFLAYQRMQGMVQEGALSARAVTISTYALCGFANPGSIAILIGGLSGVAPRRRAEVAALGVKAFVAGTLAAFTTACYAGMLA
ncbi:MAG: NupC/NupG family nucleoside CNT transporter [Planctomycetota bacterium]|jgi:CNT family concentrative nucleoside transporter